LYWRRVAGIDRDQLISKESNMSEANKSLNTLGGHAYHALKPEAQRAIAVSAALELITAKLSSGASTNLDGEVKNLSLYADQIQAALKV